MAKIEKSVRHQGYQYNVVDVEVGGKQYVAENNGAGIYNVAGECVDENGQIRNLLLYCDRCSEGRSENCNEVLYGGQDVSLKVDDNGNLRADDS
jgi:hypothetical protein